MKYLIALGVVALALGVTLVELLVSNSSSEGRLKDTGTPDAR